ncbi:MAG: Mur ligase family protein [Pseudomonadota bacterium]
MPFEFPIPVQIAYYRIERAITRPVRWLAFGRVWKRRILVAKITGSYGKTTTSRMLAAILKASGHTVGLWCSDGVLVDGRQMPGTGRSCYYGARRVFRHKNVTAAVLECTVGGQVMQGQYAPRCDVAVLLNVSDMHKGQYGLDTVEDTARVKQSIVRTSTGGLVVNLDDANSAALADTWPASAVTGFSMDPQSPAVRKLISHGGRSITLSDDGEQIVLLGPAGDLEVLARLASIPETAGGTARHVAANAMASAGLALSLGTDIDSIRTGLEGDAFAGHLKARFSIVDAPRFKLVLDKALGPMALKNGVQATARIEVSGRRVAILSAPDATTDDMLSQMAAAVANEFEGFVCHGAAGDRYAAALENSTVSDDMIFREKDRVSACKTALDLVKEQGLIYVQVAYPDHHKPIKVALGIACD